VTDTWMQPFGEQFVPGYSAVGHRRIGCHLAGAGVNVTEYLGSLDELGKPLPV